MQRLWKSTFGIAVALLFCFGMLPACADVAVAQGELRLDGSVTSYDAESGRLELNAVSFTVASGKSSAINPAKSKDILLTPLTSFADTSGKAIAKKTLIPGQSIGVIGADGGSGKPLTARLILVEATKPAATPEAADTSNFNAADTQSDSSDEVHLQPGEYALSGQIKGIFSAETIVIAVFKRADSAGKVQELGQPVDQKLHLDTSTKIHSQEDAAKVMTIGDIKLGQRISVVGKYGGEDQPFNVREMAVWKEEEQNLQKIGVVRVSMQVGNLLDRGESAFQAGAFPEALQYYKKAQQTAGALGDTGGNALAQNALGLTYAALDQPKLAVAAFQNAASLAGSAGNRSTAAIALSNLGDLYLGQRDAKNALSIYDNALNQMGSSFPGSDKLMLQLLTSKAQALSHLDRSPEAISLLHQAVGMAQQQNNVEALFNCYTELAFLQIDGQLVSDAAQNADKSKGLVPQFKNPNQQAQGWVTMYILYSVLGNEANAQSSHDQALQILTNLKDADGLKNLQQLKEKLDKEAQAAQTPKQ